MPRVPKEWVLQRLNPVRRRLPLPLVRLVVRLRTRVGTRSAAKLRFARTEMEWLVGADPTRDLDDLARKHIGWYMRRAELRWHPGLVSDQRVIGLEHLTRARDEGRGVILSFVHHAHYDGSFLALKRAGVDLDVVAAPLVMSGQGVNWLRQLGTLVSMGARLHSSSIGSAAIVELLREGRIVALASDVASRTVVHFLGRDRLASFGTPRLAAEVGCPVVVMTFEPDGPWGVALRLHEPLEPADFVDAGALQRAILDRFETAVSAWPEAYEQATERWGVPPEGARP